MRTRLALLVTLGLLIVGTPVAWGQYTYMLSWSYPYNDSTERTYTAEGAHFESILEDGLDGFHDYIDTDVQAQRVTLRGNAHNADLTIVPHHPTCWRVTMRSDYPLLKKTWASRDPCHRVWLPVAVRR